MKPEMLKVLEGNIGSVLHDIGVEKEFLNTTPFVQELRPQSSIRVTS